jgi:outer membrane receptor protein involved in Fe transport
MYYNKNLSKNAYLKNSVYYTQYDFELYSNFTFFLNNPDFGDQIREKEGRKLYGFTSEYNHTMHLGRLEGLMQAGLGLRHDQSLGNELSNTLNRISTLSTIRIGDIHETNLFGYLNTSLELGQWVLNPALRLDYFKFNYNPFTLSGYETLAQNKSILSPKLNILFNPTNRLQLYIKTGKGFHSNDTRVVVEREGKEILPAVWGADIGMIWKPVRKLVFNAALWHLFLEQEFVYVGDEGIVEPSGKTNRSGVDLSVRYQPLSWFYLDADANYAYARALGTPEGDDYIPLAPDFMLMSGMHVLHPSGLYGGVRMRHIDDRPANEDNSIVAKGYTVFDVNAGYQWRNLDCSFSIENVFNTAWNETQFATESRLRNEVEPVEEIHFIPGTPFNFKGSLAYKF